MTATVIDMREAERIVSDIACITPDATLEEATDSQREMTFGSVVTTPLGCNGPVAGVTENTANGSGLRSTNVFPVISTRVDPFTATASGNNFQNISELSVHFSCRVRDCLYN